MKALEKKRDELRAEIKALRADLKTVEAAIRIMGGDTSPQRIFKRGQLKRLVCDAMREGAESNRDIALVVIREMDWEATDERVRDITVRVKDVTKTLRGQMLALKKA
ncbi:hypothetical protein [Euryhalocaulis caribicus]|uniref:hypothetical protein n=1 Tax=Euryhalocaulis caribicus TaxID=1161401 RepID=UPI0003B6A7D2|nr:hypothetical protein [Euryhalocaulis caribicus]